MGISQFNLLTQVNLQLFTCLSKIKNGVCLAYVCHLDMQTGEQFIGFLSQKIL